MKKVAVLTANDLAVDLTLHDFSAALIAEFVEKIVRPYYSGNVSDAFRAIMQKTIREEQFVLSHLKSVKRH